jgi:hypothetical protein
LNFTTPTGEKRNEFPHLVLYDPKSFGFKVNCLLSDDTNIVTTFITKYPKHKFEGSRDHHIANLYSWKPSVAGSSYEALLDIHMQCQYHSDHLMLWAEEDKSDISRAHTQWIECDNYTATYDPVVTLSELNTCKCGKDGEHNYKRLFCLNAAPGYDFMAVCQTHKDGEVITCEVQMFQVTFNPRKHKKSTKRSKLRELKQTFPTYSITPYWIAPHREDGWHFTPCTNLFWGKKNQKLEKIVPKSVLWDPPLRADSDIPPCMKKRKTKL